MKIKTASTFTGPNIYSANPVVHFKLRFKAIAAERATAFFEALSEVLPELRKTTCAQGAPDCFSAGSEPELNHLFEHVCIELQNIAGAEVACVRSANGAELGNSESIIAYEEADVCLEAARIATTWFSEGLKSGSKTLSFADSVESFHQFSERHTLPVQDRVMLRSAHERNVPTVRLMGRLLQLGHGRHQQRLSATKTALTSVIGNDIAANKDYSRRLLVELGLPIPRYERVNRSREAVAAAERIGYPVVVKPNFGNMGQGVSVGMRNAREVRAAYKRAREFGRSILIEALVEGADFRMLVIDGELCAAAKREPAHVIGDGQQTVEQLVAEINSDPRRGVGARFSWTRIELEDQADRLLAQLNYTRQTVPEAGEVVYLRKNANTSSGGTAVDVTDEVHPDNQEIAVRAALVMGLDIAGVDLLTTDIRRSMWDTGGAICEINSRPGIRKHMWPADGIPRDVTGPIVDMLFPTGMPSRIPIGAVTGAGNRNGVARVLAHILEQSGRHVGLVTQGGAIINGRRIAGGPLTLPQATRAVLLDPLVDALVIDADPEDIRQFGLGHDACDTCIVVADDAANQLSSDITEAIGVVARTARRAIAIDGTLPCDLGSAPCFRIDRSGESAIKVQRNSDGVATGIRVNDGDPTAIKFGGNLTLLPGTPHEVAHCALHACAAAHLMSVAADTIEASLRNFASGPYADHGQRNAPEKTRALAN